MDDVFMSGRRCSPHSTTRQQPRCEATMRAPIAQGRRPLRRGRAWRPAVRHHRGQGQARARHRATAARPSSPFWARARCSANCHSSTQAPHRHGDRRHRRGPARPQPRRPAPVAHRPPRGRRAPAAGPGTAPAPHQRGNGRPRVQRRARSGRQGVARSRREVRPAEARRQHVTHDLTQEELAQLVGASRETVNKSLADFASRGWIRLEARSVVLLDAERLQRRAR